MRARLAHMSHGTILSALIESEIAALQQLSHLVAQSDIEDVARAIIRARRIYRNNFV